MKSMKKEKEITVRQFSPRDFYLSPHMVIFSHDLTCGHGPPFRGATSNEDLEQVLKSKGVLPKGCSSRTTDGRLVLKFQDSEEAAAFLSDLNAYLRNWAENRPFFCEDDLFSWMGDPGREQRIEEYTEAIESLRSHYD